MFAIIRLVLILVVILVLVGGGWYVTNLKADLAVSEMNNQKLKDGIDEQNALIEGMKKDIADIQKANTELQQQNEKQRKDVESLSKKFEKDIGKRASENPSLVERLVNRGTANAMRCLELASGAPLNEKEKAAKTPLEANRECPSLINPAYTAPN